MKFKELIAKHTTDGVTDFEQVETDFQSHINKIVIKDVKKEVGKKEAEVLGNFISELGIEATDLEGVKKWVSVTNDNSSDFKQANVTLDNDFKALTKSHGELNNEYTNFKQDTIISGLGVDKKDEEFLKYKFTKDVTEDDTFETRVDAYKLENRITTNKEVTNNFDDHSTSSPLEALKKLRET